MRSSVAGRARAAWRGAIRVLLWFRPPRRLRFTRAGFIFTVGTFAVGLAAINTANNLLYLLMGSMLGFIAVSGWLSEQMLRRLHLVRAVPWGVTAGRPAFIRYEVRNDKPRLPSFALELGERGLEARGFIPRLSAGESTLVRTEVVFPNRGVYDLEGVTLGTAFPFGLFRKERDLPLPSEAVVWPPTDRRVREPRSGGRGSLRMSAVSAGAAGHRGDYRGLRQYRPGDDPRDVHWRSTARLGEPVVREYDRDEARTTWICLELAQEAGPEAEAAVEVAAALAARARLRGDRFALVTCDTLVDPGTGTAQLERVLDALARARFRVDAPALLPPLPREQCVLVTAGAADGGYGDVLGPGTA